MKRITINLVLLLLSTVALSQPQFSKSHGLFEETSISVALTSAHGYEIRYTTDGSTPTLTSQRYQSPLTLSKTTLLRAVEVIGDSLSPVATSSYIFVKSVLSQPNNPTGYPSEWGKYTEKNGRATADYEMDPEMTGNSTLKPKIIQGLKELPILSLVSDKDNFFSHENDPDRGGIYIFTGPPVGDNTGHGWTRPASIELFGGPQQHELSINCGVRLHGGHGRLAEKNPKHSFRLVFKEQYGAKSLKYPLYGDGEPKKFDQLVLRCHFGNAWQHWSAGNNTKAQYTRDVWARRMQRKMGWTSVNAQYVHLFLNGMYWGIYNISERVDDQYGKDHLGGAKTDIDVIKIEEDGGNHIEASEGDLEAWEQMINAASRAADDTYYNMLQGKDAEGNDNPDLEALLDIDAFIDYMLINQYGGNTDWDHHNWYALRRRGPQSQGFRFLCWDSEIIFESPTENVFNKNNGKACPTGIFHNLLQNEKFARRYLRRAKEVLADDGLLGEQSVREVWDSLYYTIATALYDEAARWGDYRRDVHRYNSYDNYQLCTVDETYMNERNRLLSQYFPVRTNNVLNYITNAVTVDDFEVPDDWTKMTASMFREWNGTGINAQPLDKSVNVDWNMGTNVGGGGAIAGFVGVEENHFADVSEYDKLVLRGSGTGLRILANRLVAHGPWKQIIVSFNESDPYWDPDMQAIVFNLDDLRTALTNEGKERNDDFVHLNALKVDWNSTVNLRAAYLTPKTPSSIAAVRRHADSDTYYNLNGQQVSNGFTAGLKKGIYIRNGKKIIVK